MSKTEQLPQMPNVDRIAKWRNERLEKAEAEKQERLNLRELQRQSEEDQKKQAKLQVAKALLPSALELKVQRSALAQNKQRAKNKARALFLLCVILPVAIGAVYHAFVATPLYSASAIVAISKPTSETEAPSANLFNTAPQNANLNEVFMADAFIRSGAMRDRLEDEIGLISRWSSEQIDPIKRLRSVAVLGITPETFIQNYLESQVDIQTGLLTINIHDPQADTAKAGLDLILSEIDHHLNLINKAQFDAQAALAQTNMQQAEEDLAAAQKALSEIQIATREVDPELSVANVYNAIRQLEAEAMALEAEVQRSEITGRGGTFRTEQTRQLANEMRTETEALRSALVNETNGSVPLSRALLEHQSALLDVEIAEAALANASHQVILTERIATQNKSFLQIVVPPSVSSEPTNRNALPSLTLIAVMSLAVFTFVRLLQTGREEQF